MNQPNNTRHLTMTLNSCAECPYRIPVPPDWRIKCFAKYPKGHLIARNPKDPFPPSCPLPETLSGIAQN